MIDIDLHEWINKGYSSLDMMWVDCELICGGWYNLRGTYRCGDIVCWGTLRGSVEATVATGGVGRANDTSAMVMESKSINIPYM